MNDWASWIGRREDAEDICALPLVRRVAALLDRDPGAYRQGAPLPTGWHICAFGPQARQSDLGADGHPKTDPLMPPIDLPRRMLGGRRTTFRTPLSIGACLRRTREIVSIVPKSGRTGRLLIMTVRHSIFQDGSTEPSIVEEQDSIFREQAAPGAKEAPPASNPPPPDPLEPTFHRDLTTDPRMLFRYSAIAFNTHRIHYDRPYTTEQEGYPGLIVNGGLTALFLMDLFETSTGRSIRSIETRNKGAIICGRPIRLCGAPGGENWRLWVQDENARTLLEASVT
jgi:3-methylfumaryl-CoA hydratase